MWIYSLGICLRLTIQSNHAGDGAISSGGGAGDSGGDAQQHHLYQPRGGKKGGNGDVNGTTTSSLDQIIFAMCDPRLTQRASLMFLLDVS